MTHLQTELLLAVVKSYMQPEMRRHLMRECPAAYNAFCERTVVGSQVIDTGSPVIQRPLSEA